MGYLSKCCFRSKKSLFFIVIKQTRTAKTLADPKGFPAEKSVAKENIADVKIDKKRIAKLERISLVDFDNEGGIHRLEAAIKFAQKLREVHLGPSIRPMYCVLENQKLELREDKITEGSCRDKILRNAKILEDEYFVAPPGNIPKSS